MGRLKAALIREYEDNPVSLRTAKFSLFFKGDAVLAEISYFHDHGRELTLSLLRYLEIERQKRLKW